MAVTVTLEVEGTACGAVYSPFAEIAPNTEFPPATLFTLQLIALDIPPVTVAVN